MTVKLYTFLFSPPARLAKLAAAICGVEVEHVEVDLSKAEQFSPEYLTINPKHKVPVLEEDGVYMDESLEIVRHFFDKYNTNPNNDHWYPADPVKRQEVNKWLEWCQYGKGDWYTALHLTIRTAVVLSHMAPQQGMGWRDHFGLMLCLVGLKARRDLGALEDLKKQLATAEEILAERNIAAVEDLNVGDLSALMEISVPMECMPQFTWTNYPNINKLYGLCKQVPGFAEINQPFLEFCEKYRYHRDAGTTASWGTIITQVFTSFTTGFRVATIETAWLTGLFGWK